MKTVIMTPDLVGPINNGGIGTFVYHFSKLLSQHGEDVTIVFTGAMTFPRRQWIEYYRTLGINVHLSKQSRLNKGYGDWEFMRNSQVATSFVPDDTDILYLQGWRASGFHFVRTQRYEAQNKPVLATVLHSTSRWEQMGMKHPPHNVQEILALDFAERYIVQHSDIVISPSQYMLDWIKEWGWPIPHKQHVLQLPFSPSFSHLPKSEPHTIRQLIFFGRLETRKGLDIFVEALIEIGQSHEAILHKIDNIILLGKPGIHKFNTIDDICRIVESEINKPVIAITDLDSNSAQEFLAQRSQHALVIIPSLVDNLPYTVIEALSIPNLRVITSDTGGISELMQDKGCIFPPTKQGLIKSLTKHLTNSHLYHSIYNFEQANQNWLQIHDQLKHQAKQVVYVPTIDLPSVDIYVTHFNLGQYLLQSLDMLSQQTYLNMRVIVIDDASTYEQSRQIFSDLKSFYSGRNWEFLLLEENIGPSAVRNIALEHSNADFLIFFDADNIPLPYMVEQLIHAIHHSGDDCLTCYMQLFAGDTNPLEQTLAMPNYKPSLGQYTPIGADMILGMLGNTFGDTTMIIRRSVFKTIGGFIIKNEQERYANYEDYTILTRLYLAGYKLDVIPKVLFYYRVRHNSRTHNANNYASILRIQEIYRDHLVPLGLSQFAPTLWELNQVYANRTSYPSDANWISKNVPWYVLISALWDKIKKNIYYFSNR